MRIAGGTTCELPSYAPSSWVSLAPESHNARPDPVDTVDISALEASKADSELVDAMRTFSQAKNRPYYDEAADKKAIPAYYKDLDTSTDSKTFFKALSELVKDSHTKVLPYEPSLYLYPWVDLRPNLKLGSIYSSKSLNADVAIREDFEKNRYWEQKSQMAAATALAPETMAAQMALTDATAVLNCEHVVCQSWFDYQEPMKGDLHHLFACDPQCNSYRGNRPLAAMASGQSQMTACGTLAPGAKSFQPEAGRGAAARATLYFLVRYPKKVDEYSPADLKTLLEWNRKDPPDLYEKHRNQAIQELQGNRNPFIDHPEWADKLDFSLGARAQRRSSSNN